MSDNPIKSLRLGKRPHVHDPRRLKLAKYLGVSLPPPPTSVDWSVSAGPLGMMGNDRLGDCTCATVGHMVQVWTGSTGKLDVPSDADVVALYSAACGYRDGDSSTDNGGFVPDVLNYWRANGIGGDHRITAYADADHQNLFEVQQAAFLFGGLYIGLALPISAQGQIGGLWDPVQGANGAPNSWGGHAVPLVAYDATSCTVITWGKLQRMSWSFFLTYADEVHAVLSADWIAATGLSPSQFDMEALTQDLAAITL